MNRFAALLDRLAFEPSRHAKIRLMADYFRTTEDPDRGFALAALTNALSFRHAKPKLIKILIADRVDPYLFALSYDYVGDLSETVALLWPAAATAAAYVSELSLTDVIQGLTQATSSDQPRILARFLDALDETGRWALLKLITGALRIGVSAGLAKQAVAEFGGRPTNEIEDVWHALKPPYLDLFAWLEARADKPETRDAAPFRSAMLAHALDAADQATLPLAEFCAEWKWDGIRVQAAVGDNLNGSRIVRLFSRTGEDISVAFPDLVTALAEAAPRSFALDGELLIVRDGQTQSFGILQQRLNRKLVSPKLLADYPAHIRAYDILSLDGEDLRPLPFVERRRRLENFVAGTKTKRLDLSPMIETQSWDALATARCDPAAAGAGNDAAAIEGVMLKRADSPYLAGRPKGYWFKWKRDPDTIDAVLMYAQRGHGKRSSLYSDYTFGVWHNRDSADVLVPVGKAYFGFTDEELRHLDSYVRAHTSNRFGPVREVGHGKAEGLVLEIAFEGVNQSARHKSGLALRFPRISRIRWDKPANEADRIETLEALLKA
ncbi:cisplatin damage response ATP-dependent DNA ligase [Methylovirgula sp. HY1]|uniref:cisplatin damage response ATP-dependent DNA ligase n=1 Tax=Methylovirgula sp. HY1 TaxID=2822761 RepID=UPI001C5AA9A3|nr:cisplatin damage response ATP-dependent DNA ligase [Methylovirgula sp. HY1]QXX75646.1 DNA ligase B [Methylovirgula sp. HY1]